MKCTQAGEAASTQQLAAAQHRSEELEARVKELQSMLDAARKGLPWSPAAHEVCIWYSGEVFGKANNYTAGCSCATC